MVPFRPHPFSPPKTDEEAEEELLDIYKRALKRHLLSDVPVGLLLSGGVDSGLLLGLMSLYGKPWPTYTVGYGKQHSRTTSLATLRRRRGCSPQRTLGDPLRESFERALPTIVSVLEEPIAASSIVPMYFVCERAREDVKVALWARGPTSSSAATTSPRSAVRRSSGETFRGGFEGRRNRHREAAAQRSAEAGVYALSTSDRMRRYQTSSRSCPERWSMACFRWRITGGRGRPSAIFGRSSSPRWKAPTSSARFQVLEIRSSLPDELLMYADKLSMAHSLEARVPYWTRKSSSTPSGFRRRSKSARATKWLHRRVCEEFLPRDPEAKKRGFAVNVVDQWFQGSLDGKLGTYLRDPSS